MKTLPVITRSTLFGAVLFGISACSKSAPSSASDTAAQASTAPAATPASTAATPQVPLTFQAYKPYPYPLSTDVVSGAKLGADALSFVQGDYEIKVGSQADEDAVKKDPDTYLAKIKTAYADAKPNPLNTCVVCGMKIDASDLPFVYEGRQIQVCDKDCLADFQKDPEKYTKMWDDAAKAATAPKK